MVNKVTWTKPKDSVSYCKIKLDKKTEKEMENIINNVNKLDKDNIGHKEALKEKGLIKIEDVNKIIDEFEFDKRFCLSDKIYHLETTKQMDIRLKLEIKQKLKELNEEK